MTSPLSLTCTRTPAGWVAMRWFGCFFHPGPLLALIEFSLLPGRLPDSHHDGSFMEGPNRRGGVPDYTLASRRPRAALACRAAAFSFGTGVLRRLRRQAALRRSP